ncbi:TetR/AcrR family transcriptional regulator [Devriesea agamarum]|uniref:TetR/AcrR family transcriptional regulator n=1 Tax=Devriesea agamarum TaxID=472569 RepID=UPI00071C4E03|nr:TetR/AcrR family transcriptional regulator [Devriesea agamarum]
MAGKDTSRRVGLTPAHIATTACDLTRDRGLTAWSIRDLATELDVAPSVIYHYFPSKADIHDAVRDHVCSLVELPDDDLTWDIWFQEALMSLRRTLLQYTGVTRHIIDRVEVGALPTSLLPLYETALRKLADAGLGSKAPLGYAMIINVAMGAIAQRDRQSVRAPDRHDVRAMVDSLSPLADRSPAVALLRDDFLRPLSGTDGDAIGEHYFQLLMQSLLIGIAQVLGEGEQDSEMRALGAAG